MRALRTRSSLGAAIMAFGFLFLSGRAQAAPIAADSWTPSPLTRGQTTYENVSTPAVRILFAADSVGTAPAWGVVLPASTEPLTSFTGSYLARKVSSIRVDLTGASSQPGQMSCLILQSGDVEWYHYGLNSSAQAGVAATTRVSLDRSEWFTPVEGDLDTLWTQSLDKVDMIAVRVIKTLYVANQSYIVSGFALETGNVSEALTLEQALKGRFGVSSASDVTAADAAVDSDGDGMTDLHEILASYNPAYFEENLFKAKAESSVDGMRISWACVKGATYTVIRARSVMELANPAAYTTVLTETATETGYMGFVDPEAETSPEYFYRVMQQ